MNNKICHTIVGRDMALHLYRVNMVMYLKDFHSDFCQSEEK